MDTEKLINALAADAKRPPVALWLAWAGLIAAGVVLAAAVFFAVLGPRADIAAAVETWRVALKFAVAIVLAAGASALALVLSRPGEGWRAALPFLVLAPAMLCAGVICELVSVSPDAWLERAVGRNGFDCLGLITMIGIAPLALLLLALRHGAPTRPALAGAAAGLSAGGVAAALFAVHCTDDSPLFVAMWYSAAIGGLTLLGAIGGSRVVRW